MYRRRRPLLGAAIVMGAASAGTSRAINKQQTEMTLSAQQQEIQRQEAEKAALEAKHKEEKAAWEKEVVIDTTVQEKNISFPTDTKLRHRIIQRCGKLARCEGVRASCE